MSEPTIGQVHWAYRERPIIDWNQMNCQIWSIVEKMGVYKYKINFPGEFRVGCHFISFNYLLLELIHYSWIFITYDSGILIIENIKWFYSGTVMVADDSRRDFVEWTPSFRRIVHTVQSTSTEL